VNGETVTIVSAGTVDDPYSGEPVQDWSNPTTRDVMTIAPPEPRPSDEPIQDARNAVVSGWTLYLPAGSGVTAYDRVRVRGEEFPVQGQPAAWPKGDVVQAFREQG